MLQREVTATSSSSTEEEARFIKQKSSAMQYLIVFIFLERKRKLADVRNTELQNRKC